MALPDNINESARVERGKEIAALSNIELDDNKSALDLYNEVFNIIMNKTHVVMDKNTLRNRPSKSLSNKQKDEKGNELIRLLKLSSKSNTTFHIGKNLKSSFYIYDLIVEIMTETHSDKEYKKQINSYMIEHKARYVPFEVATAIRQKILNDEQTKNIISRKINTRELNPYDGPFTNKAYMKAVREMLVDFKRDKDTLDNGFTYIAINMGNPALIKIGHSYDPDQRVKDLNGVGRFGKKIYGSNLGCKKWEIKSIFIHSRTQYSEYMEKRFHQEFEGRNAQNLYPNKTKCRELFEMTADEAEIKMKEYHEKIQEEMRAIESIEPSSYLEAIEIDKENRIVEKRRVEAESLARTKILANRSIEEREQTAANLARLYAEQELRMSSAQLTQPPSKIIEEKDDDSLNFSGVMLRYIIIAVAIVTIFFLLFA